MTTLSLIVKELDTIAAHRAQEIGSIQKEDYDSISGTSVLHSKHAFVLALAQRCVSLAKCERVYKMLIMLGKRDRIIDIYNMVSAFHISMTDLREKLGLH